MEHQYWVYITCSKPNSTLYIGVTHNLSRRIYEHKNKLFKGFTSKYDVDKLVYYEGFNNVYDAFNREKALKEWKRVWKIRLIVKNNPEWRDLYRTII